VTPFDGVAGTESMVRYEAGASQFRGFTKYRNGTVDVSEHTQTEAQRANERYFYERGYMRLMARMDPDNANTSIINYEYQYRSATQPAMTGCDKSGNSVGGAYPCKAPLFMHVPPLAPPTARSG
jgi:hypothetical protein